MIDRLTPNAICHIKEMISVLSASEETWLLQFGLQFEMGWGINRPALAECFCGELICKYLKFRSYEDNESVNSFPSQANSTAAAEESARAAEAICVILNDPDANKQKLKT